MNLTPLRFSLNLFQRTVNGSSNQNVFISPTSAQLALSILYNGAEGQTKLQMTNLLLPRNLALDIFNTQSSQLIKSLTSDPSITLQIANSVWIKQEFPVKPSFIDRSRKFFNALIAVRNFDDPLLPIEINRWVSDRTNNKITKMVDQITRDDRIIILNAIYFKGTWARKFNKNLTQPEPFQLATGTTKTVSMMRQDGSFFYLENDLFQAVRLPYGQGRFSMLVFLPKSNQTPAKLVQSLSQENWQLWLRQFRASDGSLSLPRFRMEYEIKLNDILQQMGMVDAFRGSLANFQGLTDGRVFVSLVKQKTFIEVNEEGTEAAGTTQINVSVTSARPPMNRFQMVVDRPFLIAIYDQQTDSILFLGAIYDP
ncbi:MAG: serpin family protein [Pseudanabaenaceae cyanobacterium]